MANSAEFKYSLENIKLEDLTTISLSTDVLRMNFEIILHALKTVSKKIDGNEHELKNNYNEQNNFINQLKLKIEEVEKKENTDKKDSDDKIHQLTDSNKNLDHKVSELGTTVSQTQGDVNNLKEEIEKLKEGISNLKNDGKDGKEGNRGDLESVISRLDGHDRSLQEIMDRLKRGINRSNTLIKSEATDSPKKEPAGTEVPQIGNNGVAELTEDLDSLREELYDLKRDIVNANYLKTGDFTVKINEFKSDIMNTLGLYATKKELEEFSKQTNTKLQVHQLSIDDLYKLIDDLKGKVNNKVDCDTFDEHVADYNRLKNIVINLANSKALEEGGDKPSALSELLNQAGGGPTLSTKDANLLKDLSTKFPELEILVKKLQKDLGEHLINYKSFHDDAIKKTSILDENLKNFKNDATKRIQALEDLVKALKDSITAIQEKLDSQKQNLSSSKDLKVIPSALSDTSALSIDIKRIQNQISQIIDVDKEQDAKLEAIFAELGEIKQIKIRLNNLTETGNENRSRIISLEEDVNELKMLKQRLEALEQTVKDNKKKDKKGSQDDTPQLPQVNMDEVKKLINEATEHLRADILRIIEELKDLISKKVDSEDLWKSESTLLEKLDQVAGALIKRLADKNDTKKALLLIEKKIKDITFLIFGDPNQGEDGAMFAKKPWTCASCDVKLNKYPGGLIDYKNWNKFPANETSPERISQGKFGKGWSKWADQRRTQEKMRETVKDQAFKSTIDSLPEIHHKEDPNLKNSGR